MKTLTQRKDRMMSKSSPSSRSFRSCFAALAGILLLTGASHGGDLEKQMLFKALDVLKQLRQRGYKNVAILKFRVKSGPRATANAGPLNLKLAQRLEVALMLAHRGKAVHDPIGIIHDASAVAERLPGANHLTPEGRQKLFTADYPLAWGDKKVTPDAFLTGVGVLSSDLREMTVGILLFDKNSKSLENVMQFTARMDPDCLIDSGESFLIRGVKRRGNDQEPDEVLNAAVKVKKDQQPYPLADADAPVALEVRYDNKKVEIEIENGQARIAEPQEGQKVTLILSRKGNTDDRYGVVVKVNGQNTLGKQQKPDSECRMWVFDPGDGPILLEGYQVDDKTFKAFRVLAAEESKTKAMDYGPDVGTISVTVFREKKDGDRARVPVDPAPPDSDEEEDLGALTRGIIPNKTRPENLSALVFQLRKSARRGIVDEGEEARSDIERVKFDRYPVPLMSATIRYYKP